MTAKEFAETVLGKDLTERYGFTLSDYSLMERFDQRCRHIADQSKNQSPRHRGKAAFAIKRQLLEQLGCPSDQIDRWEYSDRSPEKLPSEVGVDRKWIMAVYAAHIMSSHPQLSDGF